VPTGRSDVLIVGAGPGGCAAGLVLASAGLDVCIVDHRSFPRDKTCGDAVASDAMAIADHLGAGSELRRGPHALVRASRAVFPDGSHVSRGHHEPGYIVPRRHLDDVLRRAAERAGANVLEKIHVRRLRRAGGRVTGAEGSELEWNAKVVIAADGPGSVGWTAVGCPRPRGRSLALAATAYFRGVAYPDGGDVSDHYFEHDLPFGYGWIFPAVDGISNVGVYQRADVYRARGIALHELLDRFVDRRRDRLGSAERSGRVRASSLPLGGRGFPAGGPGLLLVGDAGGFVDPLTGEGIWQAMCSGTIAGGVVGRAVADGEDLDDRIVARYERECARRIGRAQGARAWIPSGMRWVVDRKLYRSKIVRAVLGWGYGRRSPERGR
jgi:geranylgeranyl reductase family protein